jgi:hypothetical protein
MNTVFPFDRQKATEAAAEFIRLAGGKINILKLTKLMYLLDREALERIGVPVVGGRYVSMEHGPVTSEVLNSINHERGEGTGVWDEEITPRTDHEVAIRKRDGSCVHLSRKEQAIIGELHEQHKNRDQYELRDWCHKNCKEWVEPKFWQSGSIPISVQALATEIKRSRSEIEEAVNEARFMAKVFAPA